MGHRGSSEVMLADMGIVGRMQEMRFGAYQTNTQAQLEALRACRAFAEHPEGTLLLIGAVGTGKTHLAVSICQETCGTYTTLMRLVRNVRETYRRGCPDSEQDRIDFWSDRAMLAVDEVGVQACSDSERMLLYEIINQRNNFDLPTVLVSNETLETVGTILGERTMDRIAERGRVVLFTWASYRRRANG